MENGNLFGLFILGLIALGFAVWMVISGILSGRRLRRKALEGFGKAPEACAEEPGSIADYVDFREEREPAPERVDAATWDDLDFDRVFRRIDCCRSAVGQEYLFDRLHCLSDPEGCGRQERLIAHLEQRPEERERIQILRGLYGHRPQLHRLLPGEACGGT